MLSTAAVTLPTLEPYRVVLTVELIVANRQHLKARVLDAIARGQSTVILSGERCMYIDSSGLGAILSLAKKCREAGGSLVLEHVGPDMRYLLEQTKIDTILGVYAGAAP